MQSFVKFVKGAFNIQEESLEQRKLGIIARFVLKSYYETGLFNHTDKQNAKINKSPTKQTKQVNHIVVYQV